MKKKDANYKDKILSFILDNPMKRPRHARGNEYSMVKMIQGLTRTL